MGRLFSLRLLAAASLVLVLAGVLVAGASAERRHHDPPSPPPARGPGDGDHSGGDHATGDSGTSGSAAASTSQAASSTDHTVYVGQSGSCDGHPAYREIADGVAAVDAGGTVRVCAGTYTEDVVVTKPVTLLGENATVQPDETDASPLSEALGGNNAFTVLAPNVTISGFTVQGATSDGIVVIGDHALIENVTAQGNTINGINLDGSSWSVVRHDSITGNGGGIELANDPEAAGISLPGSTGTASHDLVAENQVHGNPVACAIYLVDHAGGGMPGIHDNVIRGNTVWENATQGFGAGVLLASPAPGASITDNTITGNTIWANGLPGVAVHSHVPGQDFSGNSITNNTIGTNNILGLEFHDTQTTGVYLGSVEPLSVVVSGNTISNDHYGIFLAGPAVTVEGASSNTFVDVPDVFGHYPTFE